MISRDNVFSKRRLKKIVELGSEEQELRKYENKKTCMAKKIISILENIIKVMTTTAKNSSN